MPGNIKARRPMRRVVFQAAGGLAGRAYELDPGSTCRPPSARPLRHRGRQTATVAALLKPLREKHPGSVDHSVPRQSARH